MLSLSSSPSLFPSGLSFNPMRCCFYVFKTSLSIPATIHARLFTHSSSTSLVQTKSTPNPADEAKLKIRKDMIACPICYERLTWNNDATDLSLEGIGETRLECSRCRKSYPPSASHLDLTITAGANRVYAEPRAPSTELFRFPLVSFLYERGWRQSFWFWGGFPGPEKEFELIKKYLKPVVGGNIVDASCGSGIFSRLFAKSRLFSVVVALDFSEAMLRQCYEFIKQEDEFPEENIVLVRGDISRLPLASGSVDAVHAGAALHCWPSPSAGVAEISRVLRPGGVLVATTYIIDGLLSYIPLLGPLRQNVAQVSGSHVFLSEREVEELCTACGLVNFKCTRNRLFVMISAIKPPLH